jgi:hypothetical protein
MNKGGFVFIIILKVDGRKLDGDETFGEEGVNRLLSFVGPILKLITSYTFLIFTLVGFNYDTLSNFRE